MTFHPIAANQKGGICLGVALPFTLTSIWLGSMAIRQTGAATAIWLGLATCICLGVGLYFCYLMVAFLRLSYLLDRNGLRIRWGLTTRRIPIGTITGILPANDLVLPAKRWFTIPLPAWWVGTWANVIFYNTASLRESFTIETTSGNIIISPEHPFEMIEAWRQRIPLGPTQNWTTQTHQAPFFLTTVWSDRIARWLVGGTILAYVLFLVFTANQPQSFGILLSGSLMLVINLSWGALWHHRDRFGAYLLWGAGLVVQVGLWGAA